MSKNNSSSLLRFLKPFDKEIIDKVMVLREFVWDLYPSSNELIYDNYNAVAFGWSPTDKLGHVFCTMAVGRSTHNIHFGFFWGSLLKDPKHLLLGEGNQYRYVLVTDLNKFPKAYIKKLIRESYAHALARVKDQEQLLEGKTIVKSISKKKRAKAIKKVAKKKGRK
jgi:hypothetical protein